MLRSMRRNTKIIMLVVAIAFVGLMVFQWGMDISGRSNPQAAGEVGRVNGTPISYQLWTRTFRSLSDQARQQKGSALNDLEIDFVEEQTWNQLVNQIITQQEIRRQGIEVSDEEVRQAFRSSPPPWLRENALFQTDGQFDYEKYQNFFANPGVDPLLLRQIEEYYRDVLPRARLFTEVASGIYVADSELWNIYRDRNEQVRIRYAVFDPETQIADSEVAISEEELREYYQERVEDFRQPATASVTMVQISRTPGPADSLTALQRAEQLRDSVLAGADFAELASGASADAASAAVGGDLGWFGRGEMTRSFEQAAFGLEVGDISEPVLTPNGYHIIRVDERNDERVRASHILVRIALAGASEDSLLATVDRLERLALTSGLQLAIDSLGTDSRQVTLSEGSSFVPGLGPFAPALDWAFHDSTFIGDISPVYETRDGFTVFELNERNAVGYLSFSDAEPSIRQRLLAEKKIETARWKMEQIAQEISAGKSLDEVAAAEGLTVQATDFFTRLDFVPGLGQYSEVIGAAFGLETLAIAGPVESGGRLFFIQVVERIEASQEKFGVEKETLRAQLVLQRREAAIEEWLADLREAADIQDWRAEFFVPRS